MITQAGASMRTVITGAGGFLGRAVTRRLSATLGDGRLVLVDREPPRSHDPRVECVAADIADRDVLARVLEGADRVAHLAAVPGGAAEADYALSRRVNLDASLTLLDLLAQRATPARLVFASSIAVFGAPLPYFVEDDTLPQPALTYGAHKLMVETALCNLVRLGRIEGLALRLPGLVARPPAAKGLKSAFMSEVFHALSAGRPFVSPVGPDATLWLMSVDQAAANIVHGLSAELPPHALTLPALHTSMETLVRAIERHLGGEPARVTYDPDPALEEAFGRLPPLATPAADRLGFAHDGDLDRLVQRALERADNAVMATS
jgi:nucleoside-diphosphate-sugar epimerase